MTGLPYAQMQQLNTNPQYPTTREIKFWDTTEIGHLPTAGTGLLQSNFVGAGFYFEDGKPGSQLWRQIQDPAVIGQLLTLGTATTDASLMQTFTPAVGKTCQYTTSQHTYQVTVQMVQPSPLKAYHNSGDALLFHGCSQEAAANIQAKGLLLSYAANGNLGRGLYGAPDPRKSLHYCNSPDKFMFVCRFNLSQAKHGVFNLSHQKSALDEFCVYKEEHGALPSTSNSGPQHRAPCSHAC